MRMGCDARSSRRASCPAPAWGCAAESYVGGQIPQLPHDRIKTVSKRRVMEQRDLLLSEEQTPYIVEKPKNGRDTEEPKEARCRLHTQEVTGSSPVAPTTKSYTSDILLKASQHSKLAVAPSSPNPQTGFYRIHYRSRYPNRRKNASTCP